MKEKEDIILIAEDDPEDRLLLKEAFEVAGFSSKVFFVEDGEELMNYLNKQGKFSGKEDSSRPKFILLDLNMPKKDGFETLKEIKASSRLKHIPTIIFTTSDLPDHVLKTYDLGGNSFIRKPNTFTALVEIIDTLKKFWIDITISPEEAPIK